MNSNRYSPKSYRPVYAPNRGRRGFIVGGDPSRECRECFGVGGHFTYCDKVQ